MVVGGAGPERYERIINVFLGSKRGKISWEVIDNCGRHSSSIRGIGVGARVRDGKAGALCSAVERPEAGQVIGGDGDPTWTNTNANLSTPHAEPQEKPLRS